MKACPNCKTMVGDDYYGACSYCGRPLGDTKPVAGLNLNTHLKQMQRETAANEAFGQQRDVSPGNAPKKVVEAARAFFPIEEIERQRDE